MHERTSTTTCTILSKYKIIIRVETNLIQNIQLLLNFGCFIIVANGFRALPQTSLIIVLFYFFDSGVFGILFFGSFKHTMRNGNGGS